MTDSELIFEIYNKLNDTDKKIDTRFDKVCEKIDEVHEKIHGMDVRIIKLESSQKIPTLIFKIFGGIFTTTVAVCTISVFFYKFLLFMNP